MVLTERAQGLITRWIEPHPWKQGVEEARLRDSKISVWALVGYLPMVEDDISIVARDYHIPVEAVEAAMLYYRQHQAAIDARLAANSPPLTEHGPLARVAS